MPTTVQDIEVGQGEDYYQSFSAVAGVDLTDWSTWDIALYVHDRSGAIVTAATCTIGTSTIVKTGTGEFYFWLKHAVTNAMTRGFYSYEVRRIDSNHDTRLVKGKMELTPYTD